MRGVVLEIILKPLVTICLVPVWIVGRLLGGK